MSKSLHSPTARLLQKSRLFSLPRPLPQPAVDNATSTGMYRQSDTATLPYPTYQAIATPASSHHRGDWGLKRALPKKATRHTSTPSIRVRALDNSAHITDFGSAADHVQTEAKWKEMGVPLIYKENRTTYSNKKSMQSVYEDSIDNTDPEVVKFGTENALGDPAKNGRGNVFAQPVQIKRWKYTGPFVTGMSKGEFELYILNTIKGRKREFRQFLMERMLELRVKEEERVLLDQGERRPLGRYRTEELRQQIQANYELEEKRLRDEHAAHQLGSELTAAICEFLDLPGIGGNQTGNAEVLAQTKALQDRLANISLNSVVHPSTHPGAGLSHVRSNAFMENHPLWGPQAHKSPVLARVVRPRNTNVGTEHQAKLGVGGIVTQDPVGSSLQSASYSERHNLDERLRWRNPTDMVQTIDPDLENGNKTWVHPDSASIDENGRIRLDIFRGDKDAVLVKDNDVETIHEARSVSVRGPLPAAAPGTPMNANYGHGLPDLRGVHPRSSMRGFDQALGRSAQQGRMQESEAFPRIKELLGEARRNSPGR